MAELASVCLRSLWQTFSSAVSSCALFIAANWGMAGFVGDTDNLVLAMSILWNTLLALAMPFIALYISVWNALQVWAIKASLADIGFNPDDHRSIAIITLCPIYVQIPTALPQLGPYLSQYRHVTDSKELEDVCPLELRPRLGSIINNTNVTHAAGALVQDSTQWLCLQVPNTSFFFGFSDKLPEREALLRLDLAPKYKELSFLRARNKFQSVVTSSQAVGYLLTVIQRVVQHLGISPIEAIVTFLSIIVTLQLLIELYACGNYQRPLLIRLDADQFARFSNEPRKSLSVYIKQYYLMSRALMVFFWFLISTPAIYYFSYYVHTHVICALSALLFFLAQTLLTLFVIFLGYSDEAEIIVYSTLFCSWVLYACSMIMAVVATAVDWRAFHHPTLHNWFAWILPHVAS